MPEESGRLFAWRSIAAPSAVVLRAAVRMRLAVQTGTVYRSAVRTQFRALVVAAVVLHATGLFVLPMFPSLFSPDTVELMKYGGHGARVNPTHPIIYWFYVVPYPALIAMYFFRNWGRYLFLAFLVVLGLGTFVLGTSISGPPETFISYAGSLIDGAIVALAFLSPIKDDFTKSKSAS